MERKRFKKIQVLAGVSKLVGASVYTLKDHSFNSPSGHIPRLRV